MSLPAMPSLPPLPLKAALQGCLSSRQPCEMASLEISLASVLVVDVLSLLQATSLLLRTITIKSVVVHLFDLFSV